VADADVKWPMPIIGKLADNRCTSTIDYTHNKHLLSMLFNNNKQFFTFKRQTKVMTTNYNFPHRVYPSKSTGRA